MKQIMITTAAMALAFSAPTFAAADSSIAKGPGSAAAADKSIAKVDTDIDVTKKTNIDVTKKTDIDVTRKTDIDVTKFNLNLNHAFNKTTVVTATKLDGHVSGNRIHDIGNVGGYATNSGYTGNGGDGGNAKAAAYSGKAVTNGGDGGNAKGGSGGDGGKSSIDQDVKNGYARNSEKADGKAFQAAKAEAEARAKGADGGQGGNGGNGGTGGAGGAGGSATTGDATVKRTDGGDGGNGGAIRVRGGEAGKFDASNTLRGSFNHAGGIMAPIQNTGAASLQQVGVTVMATIGRTPAVLP
jgi:hypothetical protein